MSVHKAKLKCQKTYQTEVECLDLEAQCPHAVFMCLNQLWAVFRPLFDDAEEKKFKFKTTWITSSSVQSFFLQRCVYQASLTFFVSGQAQHGFRGFFSSVLWGTWAASTLAADTVDIFRLKGQMHSFKRKLLCKLCSQVTTGEKNSCLCEAFPENKAAACVHSELHRCH